MAGSTLNVIAQLGEVDKKPETDGEPDVSPEDRLRQRGASPWPLSNDESRRASFDQGHGETRAAQSRADREQSK